MGRRAKEINEIKEGSIYRFAIPQGTMQNELDYLNELLRTCKNQQNLFWYLVRESMRKHNRDIIITKSELNNDINKTIENKIHNSDIKNTELNQNSDIRKNINSKSDIILSELEQENNNSTSPLSVEEHESDIINTQKRQFKSGVSSNMFK